MMKQPVYSYEAPACQALGLVSRELLCVSTVDNPLSGNTNEGYTDSGNYFYL